MIGRSWCRAPALLISLLFVGGGQLCLGQSRAPVPVSLAADPALVRAIDSVVAKARANHLVPGAVVAVVHGDSTLLRGYGYARLADSTPADPERSIYRLASVAKLFVVSVVAQQLARGTLALDRPVVEDWPGLPADRRFKDPITLRHLLTHTAGFDERVIGYAAPSRAAMRPLGEYLATRLPDRGWPAGRLVSYSNHGMALAGYLVERRVGMPFGEVAARGLFGPAGMARTYYVTPEDSSLLADQAVGYRCGGGDCEPAPVVWSHTYPVGLAFSTAADMAVFLRLHLNHGSDARGQVIDSAALTEVHAPQFRHGPGLPGMALGFIEQSHKGIRLLTHAGGVPGAATVLAMAPQRQLGVFIATNAGEPGFTKEVLSGLLDLTLGPPQPPVVQAVGRVDEYAGAYLLARYSHRTVERFPAVFAFTIQPQASGDTLVVRLGSETRRFVRVDSLALVDVERGAPMRLARGPDGRITHLYTGLPSGGTELPGAFERVPWYEAPYFLNEYISAVAGLPLVGLALWALFAAGRSIRRRRRGDPGRPGAGPVWPIGAVVVNLAVFTVFIFGFVAAASRDLGRGQGIAVGVSGGDLVLLRLAWVVAVVAVVLWWWLVQAWRRRWWGTVDRWCYTVLMVLTVAQVHFLVWWRYLPGRW